VPSTRSELRRRRPAADVLPVDQPRRAGSLDGLRIDGRDIDMVIGDRLLGARLERTIEGTNTLTLSLWDGDRRVLSSGILGRRVLSRVAEVTVDGLTYTVAGLSRDGSTLSLTCEDAIVTHLKRHGRTKPRASVRGQATRAGFCAELIRRAGVRCLVLDEDVIQPRAGAKKLRDELDRARRDVAGDRETKGRSSTIGITARGLTVKGSPATKRQRAVITGAIRAARELHASTNVQVATVCAVIQESDAGELAHVQTGNDDVGILQQGRNWIDANGAQQAGPAVRAFLVTGPTSWKRVHGTLARVPNGIEWAVTQVQRNHNWRSSTSIAAGARDYSQWTDEARAWVRAAGGQVDGGDLDGAAWIRQHVYRRKRGESTYTCVRRLLDEVRWRVFIREGVAVIASEPALARGLPALALTSELLERDDFEQHRALRAGEASLQARVGRYDADPGETVEIDTVPQLDDVQWIIATSSVDLLADLPLVDVSSRVPQRPLAEPSSEVQRRAGDTATAGDGTGPVPSGSAKRVIDDIVLPIARRNGIDRTAAVNDAANRRHGPTVSGGTSDHQGPPEVRWAADMSNGGSPTPEMDALAKDLSERFGIPWSGSGLVTHSAAGYRYQLIYRTDKGGNHFNHVHLGVSRAA